MPSHRAASFVLLVAAFAVLGGGSGTLGIYGVISYAVTRQTQEIGIRMALGATAARVGAGIIAKTLRLALLGIALGTVASFAVARGIASLLFGNRAHRSGDLCSNDLAFQRGGFCCRIHSGAPGLPHQPHDRPSRPLRSTVRTRPATPAGYAALLCARTSVLGTKPRSLDGAEGEDADFLGP